MDRGLFVESAESLEKEEKGACVCWSGGLISASSSVIELPAASRSRRAWVVIFRSFDSQLCE